MPRRTNPFQQLSSSIMAVFYEPEYEVVESVLVCNENTGAVRELDILITHRQDASKKILVECRDHKRKQNVQWIDELEGKAQRLNFSKVIAVSSSGFTKPTIAEASERGIETLHLREAEELDWRKWKFGLETFGLNVNFEPVVTKVDFIAHPSFIGRLPLDVKLDRVFIFDCRKKIKFRLKDWITGFQKDPKVKAQLAERDENDAVNHYEYKIPCDPGIGFGVEPGGQFIPLAEVILSVDSPRAEYSVPLKHFDVGGEKIHLGEAVVLGRNTKLVLHETKMQLKVMIEQRVEPTDTRDIDH